MSSNVSSTLAPATASTPATRSSTTRVRRHGISAAAQSTTTSRNTRSTSAVVRSTTQASGSRAATTRTAATTGVARNTTQASGSRAATTRTATSTAVVRTTTQASGSRTCTTRRSVRPSTTAVAATRTSIQTSGSPTTRRNSRAVQAPVLTALHERSPVSSPRGHSVDGATGSRGRCTRNVHVDKEVQTENRNEVSVSLNALKRRRQSLSPTTLPCSVCFNEMHPVAGRSVISLKCGHIFCQECIETITKSEGNKFCPLCLEPVHKRHFRKIYFC